MCDAGHTEGWVTFALDDQGARRALILAKSLRRVFTNRKVLILVAPATVSSSLWPHLTASFDGVYPLPPTHNWATSSGEGLVRVCATVHCWSLVHFTKLVFLDNSSLVLENADEIFAIGGGGISVRGGGNTGMTVLAPSFEKHMQLLEYINKMQPLRECKWTLKDLLGSEAVPPLLEDGFSLNLDEETLLSLSQEMVLKAPKILHIPRDAHHLARAPFLQSVWEFRHELENEVDTETGSRKIRTVSRSAFDTEPIAIVGMSCRMPGANNVEEYWKVFTEGECVVRDVPHGRWTSGQSCVLTPEYKKTQAGFLSCPVDKFDAKFFGISPLEMTFTDPQQRLLLEVAWEALEDAGINPHSLKGTNTGIFAGGWTLDYKKLMIESGFDNTDIYRSYMGNSFATLAARLAHFFGVTGPNLGPEVGCSSASVAVGLGVQSLRRGETNLVLSSGVNLLNRPFAPSDLQSLLSTDYRCKVFDADANGFARAEGCGVLVLKRLSDAVRDGDRIHALIRGYGVAQEGNSKSMGTPTIDTEALAMRLALKDANLLPSDVQLVEAHGTGTAVGDPMEIQAIARVYSTPERTQPLIITAGKANTGHTESVSGIAGIIKTILEFKNQLIPPHISVKTLNPRIDLGTIPAEIPLQLKQWVSVVPRVAGVSSFGISGTDTHLILQEPPKINRRDSKFGALKSHPQHVLTLSAKSPEALQDLVELYKEHLINNPDANLEDVAFTANTGRAQFRHRFAVSGKSCAEIVAKIDKRAYEIGDVTKDKVTSDLCFLFTGQGSQHHGMGKVLYDTCPVFQVNFDMCEQALKSLHGFELKDALWGEDASKVHHSLYSQSAIFVIEYCLFKLWESWGVRPMSVLGHSLGEFAAATAAGLLSVHDALKLLGARCRLIDSLPGGKLMAVKADEKATLKLLSSFVQSNPNEKYWLDVAAVNSPDQTTLAGPPEVVKEFEKFCLNNETKTHILDATHAYHSRAMEPILKEYEAVAKTIHYNRATPGCTFVSGAEGKAIIKVDADYWVRHTRDRVQFRDAATAILPDGGTQLPIFLEVGPHPVLSALIYANTPPEQSKNLQCFLSMRKKAATSTEFQTLVDTVCKLFVQGVEVNWAEFHRFHGKQKVSLPFYPFQHKKFWFPPQKFNISRKQLHPLLGSRVELPRVMDSSVTATESHFQNFVSLKTHEYIGDHKVGKFFLLPAAGFLEMALSAASTVQDLPLLMEDIVIKAPLVVEEMRPREVHTVLSWNLETEEDRSTRASQAIFSRDIDWAEDGDSTSGRWDLHSEAKLSIAEGDVALENSLIESLETIKERVVTPALPDVYNHLTTLGYNFGPLFQTLTNIRRSEGELLAKLSIPADLHDERDLCHPVVIDAMIQAYLLSSKNKIDDLHLPVAIKRFLLLGTSKERIDLEWTQPLTFHVHVKDGSPSKKVVTLYSKDGTPLALMSGVELVKTSLQILEKSLNAADQKNAVPPMYLEEWRPCTATGNLKFDAPFLAQTEQDLMEALDESQTDVEGDVGENAKLDKYVGIGILKAFLQLGLKQRPAGEEIHIEVLMKELGILPELLLQTRRLVEALVEDGYMQHTDTDFNVYKVLRSLPTIGELTTSMNLLEAEEVHSIKFEWQVCLAFLDKLGAILRGDESALSLLFPENEEDDKVSANKIYTRFQSVVRTNLALKTTLNFLLKTRLNAVGNIGLNILEVGSGTGSSTKYILPVLADHSVKYSYTFTDISSVFFSKARDTFAPYVDNMKFKVLNVEEDPKGQGFAPNQFDLVIANNVLHATRDLAESCRNMRLLMKNYGVIIIAEMLRPLRILDITFSLLHDLWRFRDLDLRPKHCLIDGRKWCDLLRAVGFMGSAISLKTYGDRMGLIVGEASGTLEKYIAPPAIFSKTTWLVLGDSSRFTTEVVSHIKTFGKSVVTVAASKQFQQLGVDKYGLRRDSKEDYETLYQALANSHLIEHIEGIIYMWGMTPCPEDLVVKNSMALVQSYLHFLQTMLVANFSKSPKVFLVTRGQTYIGDQAPTLPNASPLPGIFRSFTSENSTIFGRHIDLSPDADEESDALNIVSELWTEDGERYVAYRGGIRLKARLVSTTLVPKFPPLEFNLASPRFHLVLSPTNSIANLTLESIPQNKRRNLGDHEVEVMLRASGLNFQDIFNVLKPTEQFEQRNTVGMDFCGVILAIGKHVRKRKVGEAVLGCNYQNEALPSHVIVSEDVTAPLPPHMTYAEGATLPTVFITAYHCLIMVANLTAGETILIHSASGGVGLCSIQIARDVGATVIATAGSRRKREYLKFIGVKHVFNSRDLTFGNQVLEATGGRGVDLVLNSLTGPGFKETSFRCCAANARFAEIGKLNIWTVGEAQERRPDVRYSVEDLSIEDPQRMLKLFEALEKYLNDTTHPLQPLPYTRFDAVDIRDALSYLEKAKQIGKVVCTMPVPAVSPKSKTLSFELFNDRSTYLVTGGCGGIGFEVGKWMCRNGAKFVLLCSRRAPNEQNAKQIETLNDSGSRLMVVQGDVGDFARCEQILKWVKGAGLPPLRGIMHCAGCLSDATIPNQTMETFETTLHPKLRGAWNLHQLTQGSRLEHFVMFSSVSCVMGSPGQSNHSASNAFLDGLAQYRASFGLPATTINWGQWGETGIAAGKFIQFLIPLTTKEALNSFERILKSHLTKVAAIEMNFKSVVALFPCSKSHCELVISRGNEMGNSKGKELSSDEFWEELNIATCPEQQYSVAFKHVGQILATILSTNETIEKQQNFQDLGVDSLMMIELKNHLQRLLGSGVTVTSSDLADCNTLDLTTRRVLQLASHHNTPEGQKAAVLHERNQMIREDAKLWSHIQTTNSAPPVPLAEVKTVFVTGTTGNLGPYIVQQLTQNKKLERIYCLVRPGVSQPSTSRLIDRLTTLDLLSKTDMSKVTVVSGNVVEDQLGLGDQLYTQMAIEMEAVVHCAVHTSHLELYGKGASTRKGLRAVNVTGTHRMLEFAAKSKVKWFFNASTLLAMWIREAWYKTDRLPEHWPEEDDFDEAPSFGYGISKFIADRLVAQGVQRGIPCKSFRYPKIMGQSITGRQELVDNHFLMKFIYFIKTGVMPDLAIPLMGIPVDKCAQVSLHLFFDENVPSGMYNLTNPHFQWEKDLGVFTHEFGPQFRIAEQFGSVLGHIEEFRNAVADGATDNVQKLLELLATYGKKEGGIDMGQTMDLMGQVTVDKEFFKNPSSMFKNEKVRSFLKERYGFPMTLVPYPDFVQRLMDDGEMSILHNWIDFYTRDDSVYKLSENCLNKVEKWKEDPVKFLSLGKVHQYIPELDNIIPNPLQTVRTDLEYVLIHADKVFGGIKAISKV